MLTIFLLSLTLSVCLCVGRRTEEGEVREWTQKSVTTKRKHIFISNSLLLLMIHQLLFFFLSLTLFHFHSEIEREKENQIHFTSLLICFQRREEKENRAKFISPSMRHRKLGGNSEWVEVNTYISRFWMTSHTFHVPIGRALSSSPSSSPLLCNWIYVWVVMNFFPSHSLLKDWLQVFNRNKYNFFFFCFVLFVPSRTFFVSIVSFLRKFRYSLKVIEKKENRNVVFCQCYPLEQNERKNKWIRL